MAKSEQKLLILNFCYIFLSIFKMWNNIFSQISQLKIRRRVLHTIIEPLLVQRNAKEIFLRTGGRNI
jgi:hypothetical protein